MKDISNKISTLRTASAVATLHYPASLSDLVKGGVTPKGNIFEIAKTAALIAAKQTPILIPFCHPVSIDGMAISYEHDDRSVQVRVTAQSVGRTGIEMEVLTAATVAALNLYDLLKPFSTDLSIGEVCLEKKNGGKSEKWNRIKSGTTAAVLTISDTVAAGKKQDGSGQEIKDRLSALGVSIHEARVVADEPAEIRACVESWIKDRVPFIFTTGGTGLGPRDKTIEALTTIIERPVPGIAEAMRSHGSARTPLAMLSRSLAGTSGSSIIVALPGSRRGVSESLDAIFPAVFHGTGIMNGGGHDDSGG